MIELKENKCTVEEEENEKIEQLINKIELVCNNENVSFLIPALSCVLYKMQTIFVDYVSLKNPDLIEPLFIMKKDSEK